MQADASERASLIIREAESLGKEELYIATRREGDIDVRLVTKRFVLDSHTGDGDDTPVLFIRPQNADHDYWLRYDPDSGMLEIQGEDGWDLMPFDPANPSAAPNSIDRRINAHRYTERVRSTRTPVVEDYEDYDGADEDYEDYEI